MEKSLGGISGTCPEYFPTSLRAELWTIMQALRYGLAPITIWCDNQGVLDAIGNGRHWCCSCARPCADLWVFVCNRLLDIGVNEVTFANV